MLLPLPLPPGRAEVEAEADADADECSCARSSRDGERFAFAVGRLRACRPLLPLSCTLDEETSGLACPCNCACCECEARLASWTAAVEGDLEFEAAPWPPLAPDPESEAEGASVQRWAMSRLMLEWVNRQSSACARQLGVAFRGEAARGSHAPSVTGPILRARHVRAACRQAREG